ncbi:methanobactin [Chitinimonas lacunae]|uniref:Methanobactin n=1 Tax=Chitinimonas lacunae TaxID=1963018 RepID=A0ABV8MK99_9NEIS
MQNKIVIANKQAVSVIGRAGSRCAHSCGVV